MSKILEQALIQSPGLVALLYMLIIVLRHIEKRDVFIRQLHDEHIQARRESQAAIHDNTTATRDLTKTITEWRNKP